MSNDNGFLKKAEKVTMEKLLNIASRMMRAEEIVSSLTKTLSLTEKPDHVFREYLLQKSELAKLKREIDDVVRKHEIKCRGCGELHKLRSLRLSHWEGAAIIFCPSNPDIPGVGLNSAEEASLDRILQLVQGEVKDIFDTKVP